MAPENSRRAINEFGRPQYDQLIAEHPTEIPLEAKAMVTAFHPWDEEIGEAKLRRTSQLFFRCAGSIDQCNRRAEEVVCRPTASGFSIAAHSEVHANFRKH